MRRLFWACAAVALLATAACTDDDDEASPSSTKETRPASTTTVPERTATTAAKQLAVAWTVKEPKAVAKPAIVGDVAVTLGTRGRELVIFGASMQSGEVLWEQSSSPGYVVPGIAVVPAVFDGTIVHFRPEPDEPFFTRLVALDHTGTQVWQSDPFFFRSTPLRCFDERDICLDAHLGDTAESRTFRFDLAGGDAREERSAPQGSRPIGPKGLIDLGPRNPEFLARVGSGGVTWQTPLVDAFSDRHSTDGGWRFDHFRDGDAFVGSVGIKPPEARPDRLDLESAASAGLDAATGRVLWKDAGSQFGCRGAAILTGEDEPNYEKYLVPVRCRYAGATVFNGEGERPTYEGLAVVLEGFDVRTGRTTWSIPLGALESFVFGQENPPVAGNTTVLIRGPGGPKLVDITSGKARAPGGGAVFWCSQESSFDYQEGRGSEDDHERRGGRLFRACTAAGAPSARLPSTVPEVVGVRSGRRAVVATPEGLVAYDLPA